VPPAGHWHSVRERLARPARPPGVRRGLLTAIGHPARIVALAFAVAITVGSLLLSLPVAHQRGLHTDFVEAFFTATSAVSITGLSVVDTSTHWSTFGQLVILVLIQIGGIGVMTLTSMLAVVMSPRLRLRFNFSVQTETGSLNPGDIGRVVRGVVKLSLFFELIFSIVLSARLYLGYDRSFGAAVYEGTYHGISAFNNAGFALYTDSLTRYATDPVICIPVGLAVIVGSLGFPVLLELRRELFSPRTWSLHTKITIWVSAILLLVGPLVITVFEWGNARTLGSLDVGSRLMAGWFQGIMPRSGGLNTVDIGSMNSESLLVTDILMFIGGGSASTAGGIKVTTFAILAFVILAEIRGEPDVRVLNRTIRAAVIRQALTVVLLSVGVIVATTLLLLAMTDLALEFVLFDVISAFATVGLSAGGLSEMPPAAHVILAVLMFVGRLGPITVATALAAKERTRRYRLPEERPIVG